MEQVETTEVTPGADEVVESQVTIRLQASDHKKIMATRQELAKVAAYFLEHYARGGVMLRAAQAHYIEHVAGIPVKTPETIISIIESGINRRSANGNLSVTYSVDPAFAQPLEDLAVAQGRTVEEIVQESMSIVFTNQWLYALDVGGMTLHFDRQDREEIQKMTGNNLVTGKEFMQWARETQEKKAPRVSKLRQQVRERMDQEA